MLNIFDPQFEPPQSAGIVGSRYEHYYCPEYGQWVVIDRQDGSLTKCTDRGEAAERAALLESIRRLVRAVADATEVR